MMQRTRSQGRRLDHEAAAVPTGTGRSAPTDLPVGLVRFRTFEWIEQLDCVSSTEAAVLLYLTHRIDQTCRCRPSRQRISHGIKLHRNTVTRAIQSLEQKGIVRVWRERSRKGNTFYRQIEINSGATAVRPGDTVGTRPVPGASTFPVLTNGSVSTAEVFQKEATGGKKIQLDLGVEGEMPLAARVERSQPISAIQTAPGNPTEDIDPIERPVYAVRPVDELAIATVVWWDLFHLDAYGKKICVQGQLRPEPLSERQAKIIQASMLASDYWKGAIRAPRARVAYWHALGRLFYPTLPRFASAHRLSALQAKSLHGIFRDCLLYTSPSPRD